MDKPVPIMVRCLGPGPEHVFLSRDVRNNRVCSRCRAKIEASNLSVLMEQKRNVRMHFESVRYDRAEQVEE